MAKYEKYTKEMLSNAVIQATSYTEVLRALNIPLAGGNHTLIKSKIKKFELDTSHFLGCAHNKGKQSKNRKLPSELLTIGYERRPDSYRITRALIEIGRNYKCEKCSITDTYNGEPIVLEVDHINGDWSNNTENNLRFLCPNCHSQVTKRTRQENRKIKEKISYKRKPKIPKTTIPFVQSTKIDLSSVDILDLHFNKKMSKMKIGKLLGVSHTTVRKYITKLKKIGASS